MLARRYIPESHAQHRPASFDFAGAVTVTAGLIVLVYAILKAEEFGWGSVKTLGLGALAIALPAAFVLIERRSSVPLVRLGIFKVRSLLGANLALLVRTIGVRETTMGGMVLAAIGLFVLSKAGVGRGLPRWRSSAPRS